MKKKILVAPLNWGIGHACRCIPIINALIAFKFEVVIASDNEALLLLQKEFPELTFIELPGYKITYTNSKKTFKSHLIKQLPKIRKAIRAEYNVTQSIIKTHHIDGIISDNRLGVYSKNIPSVFITHQLNVLTGSTTFLSTRIHQYYLKRFNECWIPDTKNTPNLSGKLGHTSTLNTKTALTYIGALSRFEQKKETPIYDILILLSGPEPQRGILEQQLYNTFKDYNKKVLLVKGIIETEEKTSTINNLTTINFLTSKSLETVLNQSEVIIARSGYTSIMDFAKLNKKVFFIPTPGQFEQNYLAQHLEQQHIAPYCEQEDFNLEQLKRLKDYKGFTNFKLETRLDEKLFDCFI